DYTRDYRFDYFGFKTLERSYLMRINGQVMERPQNLLMRVALAIHGDNLSAVQESYEYMSEGYLTHATPTLFNAGTNHEQLSSCYLLGTEDSLEGIFKTVTGAARISKWAGGIGIHISNIRATGSRIRGTNGESTGIVPMLKTYEAVARYINQGSKRNGSIAIYLEPWHGDIMEFLELRRPVGEERLRTRDLYLALWINDIFMERLIQSIEQPDGPEVMWSLMCPNQSPGLCEVYGEEFNRLYLQYETQGRYLRQIPIREIWRKVLDSQIESGLPYIGYKDHVNRKSNQKNLGTIRSSNLCIEIMEYSDQDNYAVCNLASLALPRFIEGSGRDAHLNYRLLAKVAGVACRNLNRVIDINYYPTEETRRSNLRTRPIGIGIQGLADVFCQLKIPYESDQAKELNRLM
ncbi:MAG: ribonucleoside-diphosphate reductase subunit alpha, partial [Bacteroidetes bacterium RIFCSPHIGHO2_02_FULL_44_7]